MDEARVVLGRLQRIEALRRERAAADAILAEVDRLLDEARVWLAAEGGDEAAAAHLRRVRAAVIRSGGQQREAMIPM